jgi:glycosyltransferase involved in cell wall biosynthesis
VSVVIPCYNQARFLGEAVESVLAQSYRHFKVIVVDDGSTDNTAEVAARYPEIRYFRQDNRGLSAARNGGFAHSEGEHVVFLDADDRLLPEALEAGLERFEAANPQCAFVSGHFRYIAADGSILQEVRQRIVGEDRYAALLQSNYIVMHATVMYRRAVFESVGGFDTSLGACEDYDMYLRIARRFPVCSYNKVVAEYRRHDTGMSSNPAIMLSTSVTVLRSQRKYVKRHKQYREAYEIGIRSWRDWYGDPLVEKLRASIKKRDWKRAVQSVPVLLRYYPQGLALLSGRRMARHMEQRRLARRLMVRKQELKVREQRLRELESSRELERALVKECQEVQQLRRRIRLLERQIQNLDRGTQIKRMFKRLRLIGAKSIEEMMKKG